MEWNEIKTQSDADELMDQFGGFHDACIREGHFWTGTYVSEDLSMAPGIGLETNIKFHIQMIKLTIYYPFRRNIDNNRMRNLRN